MNNMNDNKHLTTRGTDLEHLKVVVDSLADILEIYQYLEDTPIRDVKVSVNDNDFNFELEGEFLETAMKGLRNQLKSKTESLRAQIKLL